MLEEGLRLFCRTKKMRMLRIQCLLTETLNCIPVHHLSKVLIIPHLDLLILMRSSETVEEMHHRQLTCDSCKMSNRAKIHNLLNII